jgi:tRNA (guanine6-N2)-methyltransferase
MYPPNHSGCTARSRPGKIAGPIEEYEIPMSRSKSQTKVVEIEVAQGLEDIALDEILSRYANRIVTEPEVVPGAIRFGYRGNLGGLLALNTVIAVYLLDTYDIPRPKAFLGHQHFTRLQSQILTAQAVSGTDAYTTITVNAAGSQSRVMQRLLDELATALQLIPNPDEGDLTLRIRRAVHGDGWDVLVRLSPRPNATRDWRVTNIPGALNASVAHAMVVLSDPGPDDVVFNVACGSGTLAIERLRYGDAQQVYTCDNDLEMLQASESNITAAGLDGKIELNDWDATDLPMSPSSVDVVLADLPFGHRVGSHRENRELYPSLLQEAARVVRKDGCAVIITHEIKLMEAVLLMVPKWYKVREIPITLSGLHPRIYVLRRV